VEQFAISDRLPRKICFLWHDSAESPAARTQEFEYCSTKPSRFWVMQTDEAYCHGISGRAWRARPRGKKDLLF